jgi:hypothetical protein
MQEEHAHEVVEHLQSAALELIAAARAFLDMAEEMVKEPTEAVALATTIANKIAPPGPPPGVVHSDDTRVERIRVS